jgi:hypothetical protein
MSWYSEPGVWEDKPRRHDAARHGADAFRCLASRYRDLGPPPPPKPKPKPQENAILHAEPGGRVIYAAPFSILEWAEAKAGNRRKGGVISG